VRAGAVVVPSPFLDAHAGLLEGVKHLAVKESIPQLPVEAPVSRRLSICIQLGL